MEPGGKLGGQRKARATCDLGTGATSCGRRIQPSGNFYQRAGKLVLAATNIKTNWSKSGLSRKHDGRDTTINETIRQTSPVAAD